MFTLRRHVETLIPRLGGRKKFFQVIYDELKRIEEVAYITNFYQIAKTSRLPFMSSCFRRRKYDFKSDDYLLKKEQEMIDSTTCKLRQK